jgi:hypothetical protein
MWPEVLIGAEQKKRFREYGSPERRSIVKSVFSTSSMVASVGVY